MVIALYFIVFLITNVYLLVKIDFTEFESDELGAYHPLMAHTSNIFNILWIIILYIYYGAIKKKFMFQDQRLIDKNEMIKMPKIYYNPNARGISYSYRQSVDLTEHGPHLNTERSNSTNPKGDFKYKKGRSKSYLSDPEEENEELHKIVLKKRASNDKHLMKRISTFQLERRNKEDADIESMVTSINDYETEARFLTEAPGDPTYLKLDYDYYSLALYAFYLNDTQIQVLKDLSNIKKEKRISKMTDDTLYRSNDSDQPTPQP